MLLSLFIFYLLYCLAYTCRENEYRCKSDGMCIKREELCDGVNHCTDESDELDENCDDEIRHNSIIGKTLAFIKLIFI